MNPTLNISLPQIPLLKGNVAANLRQHLQAIEVSAIHGADLVVFPELSLTGYELELLDTLALDKDHRHFSALSEAAVAFNVGVIAGYPLIVDGADKPTIGAVICHPDGRVEFYDKQYLHDGEERYCSAGAQDYLFTLNGYTLALAICADFTAPEHAKRAAAAGADIYLVSALISEAGFAKDAEILSNIAASHKLHVLLSNHISVTGGWSVCGNNSIWQRGGELEFGTNSVTPGIAMCYIRDSEVSAVKLNP
ncbi:carbon-nitrogen hydrolase family protein [Aliagarivorans marinus]|uniref:carbon-nitrogen hydrolase family protein n=1 Tax=Aliagarivorans marinus TaxID=561965 RepID=UPI00041D0AF4|nr:carbon-nitrogen hydrolase family protein [Aliagarivorans marinus]